MSHNDVEVAVRTACMAAEMSTSISCWSPSAAALAPSAASLTAQAQGAMAHPAFRCCVPYEHLLAGADGTAQPQAPPLLKHHAAPLELSIRAMGQGFESVEQR